MTPAAQIARLDREITAIHKELCRRERIRQLCTDDWQNAWDRHPELREREHELFRQRGAAQRERDAAAEKAWRTERRRRPAKCPTCNQVTYTRAA